MSGSFMTVGQGIADSLRIVAVAQLVEDTIINTELFPVVLSKEAVEYYSQKEKNEKAPGRSTVPQTIPAGSANLSFTATSNLLSGGDPLSHIPTQVQVNTSFRVGCIPVESNVSSGGAITYSVPISCAPGRNGLGPTISVVYNSMGGNGPVGNGWAVSGLSSISRVSFNRYYNGYSAPMKMDETDPFMLDGNRILPTSTAGQYETYQGNIKVVPVLNDRRIVAYFNVSYPDGKTAIYGFPENQSNQLFYPITKLTDILGNQIEFSYTLRNNHYYIDNIHYGKNNYTTHYARINFVYKVRNDVSESYYGGRLLKEDYLLDKIISYSGSDIFHTYTLTYIEDKVSLLDRIDCDDLNPLKFYYGYNDNQTAALNKTEGILYSYFNEAIPVITRKGKFDWGTDDDALLIYPDKNNTAVYYKKGGLFSHSTYYYYTEYNSAQALLIYQSLAETFPLPSTLTAGSGFMELTSGDFDGKSGEEVVKINNTVTNNYDRVTFTVYQPSIYSGLVQSYVRSWDLNPALTHYNSPKSYWPKDYFIGDFNGDGRMDMLCLSMNHPLGQTDKKSKCTLIDLYNNVKMYDAHKFEFDRENDKIIPMDYDGDGKTDICFFNATGMYMYTFNGSGSTQSLDLVYSTTSINRTTFLTRTVLSGDLNADGMLDLMVAPVKSYYNETLVDIPVWAPVTCPYCGGEYPILNEFSHNCRYCSSYIQPSPVCFECGSSLGYGCDEGSGSGLCCPLHGYKVQREVYEYIDNGNQWSVYYGSGDKISPFSRTTHTFINDTYSDRLFAQDIDQDGSSDIVRQNGNSMYVYLSKNGLLNPDNNSVLYSNICPSATKLVQSSVAQPNFHNFLIGVYNNNLYRIFSTRNESKQRLLTGSVTSTGIVQRNYYNQLNDGYGVNNSSGLIYTRGYNATFPYENYMGPLWVASMQETFHNGVLSDNTSFNYHNAVIHRQGLGFRGFEKVTTTNLLNNHYSSRRINPLNYGIPVKDSTTVSEVLYQASASVASNKKLTIKVNRTTVTDKLRNTTRTVDYTYDSYNNLLTELVSFGGGISTLTSQTYNNSAGTPYLLGVPLVKTVTRTRNGVSWIDKEEIQYYPNSLPKLKRTYTGTGGTLKTGEVKWTYDANGNLMLVESAPYDVTDFIGKSFTYDPAGRYLATESNAIGQTTIYANYDKYGNARTVTNYKGQVTTRNFDQWGQPTSVVHPDGVTESTVFSWGNPGIYYVSYNTTGQPARKIWYDAFGREVRHAIQRFDGTWQYVDKVYDYLGRLQKLSLPFKGSSPVFWNNYLYDNYNRPQSVTESTGRVTSWNYSALNITETKDGISSTRTFDVSDMLIGVTDPGGTISYLYRPDLQLSSIASSGNETSFGYDQYGRQNTISDPSVGTLSFSEAYVNNRLVKTQTDANGNTITTNYDRYGRITSSSRPEFNTRYCYNADGLPDTITSTNNTSQTIDYDDYNRIYKIRETVPDSKYLEKTYIYSGGNVSAISYASQGGSIGTENYLYAYGHNTEIKLNNNITIMKVTDENAFGQSVSAQTGPIARTYSYSSYGIPTGRKAGNLQDFDFRFDSLTGNLLTRKDNKRGITESFLYDNLNRLKEIGGAEIGYSPSGNLTHMPGTGVLSYDLPDKPYAVTMLTPEGGAVPMRDQQVTYTSFNRPSSVTENGVTAAFTYNQNGDRVKMDVTGSGSTILTRYYISGQYEFDATTASERLYLGGDPYSAPTVYVKEAGVWKIYYLCRDYLGSITHIANPDGTLKQEISYTPWGRLRNPSTQAAYAPGTEPSLFLNRGYTGHEYLPWFGLINMNARLYDPALGRFVAPDPYVQVPDLTQAFNRYSYCINNPLKYTDPNGNQFSEVRDAYFKAIDNGYMGSFADFSYQYYDQYYSYLSQGSIFNGSGGATMSMSFSWHSWNDYSIHPLGYASVHSSIVSERVSQSITIQVPISYSTYRSFELVQGIGGQLSSNTSIWTGGGPTVNIGAGIVIGSSELRLIPLGRKIVGISSGLTLVSLSRVLLYTQLLTLQGDTRSGQQWQRNQDQRGQRLERDLLKAHGDMLNNSGVNNQGFPNDPSGFVPEGAALLFGALKAFDLYMNWNSVVVPDSMTITPTHYVYDTTLVIRQFRPGWKP